MPSAAILGVGLITALGASVEETLAVLAGDAVRAVPIGVTGAGRVVLTMPIDRGRVYARLRLPKLEKYLSWPSRLALAAVEQAWCQAGWGRPADDADAVGVYASVGETGLESEDFFAACSAAWEASPGGDYDLLGGRPLRLVDPYFALRTLTNGAAALVAIEYGARGPAAVFVQAPVGAAAAIEAAVADLAEGACDRAIVLATDSRLGPTAIVARARAGQLAPDVVLSEGAAALALVRAADAPVTAEWRVRAATSGLALHPSDRVRAALADLGAEIRDAPLWVAGPQTDAARMSDARRATWAEDAVVELKAGLGDLGAASPLAWAVLSIASGRPAAIVAGDDAAGAGVVVTSRE